MSVDAPARRRRARGGAPTASTDEPRNGGVPQDTADVRAARAARARGSARAGDGDSPDDDLPLLRRLRRSARELRRRRLAPALAVVTPVGWTVAGAATVCWVVGLSLRITELNVLALALSVPLLLAALFVMGKANYRVQLDLRAHRVVVGTRAVGRIEASNPTQRTILPSRIELTVGASTAQFLVPRLAPEASHEELFAVPTRRRAVLVVGPVRSVRDDPLSLMRRQVTWARAQEVFVHPRTVRLDEAATGFLRDLEGTPSSDLSSSDIAFHALREYAPGDDRRHVHWKSVARTGKLMVRQFEETRRSHVVVALDTASGRFADDDEFELAVSAAASIAGQTFREEKQLTAFTLEERQRTGTFRALMDDYTVVAPTRARRSLHELGQRAADLAPGASAVMMAVGSLTTARELSAAASQLPPGVMAVAIRCAEGAEARRSAIGSLHVLTIGDLDQLGRALRGVGR